jgi:hypothetical protein
MIEAGKFSQIGGVRLDSFNISWPFAKISVSPNTIELNCFLKKYVLKKDQLKELREYKGIFSRGLLIEHSLTNYPQHMVFWTFRFENLKKHLESMGYLVNASRKSAV